MITNERGWKWVGIFLMLMSCMVMFLAVTGGYHIIWGRHDTSAEIYSLSQRNEALRAAVIEKDAYIEKQGTAMRFENLFLLAADQNDLMDFTMLEEMLCEKRGLCK